MVDNQAGGESTIQQLGKQTLEINAKHPIMVSLLKMSESNAEVADLVAEQVFDNALVSAGLLDDARSQVPRLNNILDKLLKSHQ